VSCEIVNPLRSPHVLPAPVAHGGGNVKTGIVQLPNLEAFQGLPEKFHRIPVEKVTFGIVRLIIGFDGVNGDFHRTM